MKPLRSRPCSYLSDVERILNLLMAHRAATGVRIYPTTWRVRLLLTSRLGEPAQDARVWEDANGDLAALAFLWRRQPTAAYLVLERFVRPRDGTVELAAAMLAWGSQRAEAIASAEGTPLTLYAPSLAPRIVPDDPQERYGLRPTAPGTGGHNVYLARDLESELPAPRLPPGTSMRPLLGEQELEAYRKLHGFSAVDPEHRLEQLESEEYSHLVTLDAGGELVAYCECSITRAEWSLGQGRIGWIDYIGTREDRRRQGWGQAALLGGLAQLRAWGAEVAMVVTVSTNQPALGLYARVGFEPADVPEAPSYEKLVPGS